MRIAYHGAFIAEVSESVDDLSLFAEMMADFDDEPAPPKCSYYPCRDELDYFFPGVSESPFESTYEPCFV